MRNTSTKPTITLVGAGLGGVFLAILFAKRGYHVRIFERFSEQDVLGNASQRSFNITFFGYGVTALKEVGLWKKIMPVLLRLTGSATQLTPHANYTIEQLDEHDLPYYAVSRAGLLKALVDAARKYKTISFHFNSPIVAIDRYAKTMMINKSGTLKTITCDVIFGSDGVNSIVRSTLQQNQETIHTQIYTPWTYKQIRFTKTMAAQLNMNPKLPYSWTRERAIIAGFPQKDGVFGALLILPKNKNEGFAAINSEETVKKLITTQFPVLLPALKKITSDILENPEGHFVTVKTSPWYYKDFMALMGDAAHGCLPFYGLGTSAAFGDAMELMKLVDKYGPDWGKIFPMYQQLRKKNTDVIADLSQQGMQRFTRSSRADREAIFDKLEDVLHGLLPNIVLPSIFKLIINDPNHSWESFKNHEKQRRVAKSLGISVAVRIVTILVALQEKINQTLRS